MRRARDFKFDPPCVDAGMATSYESSRASAYSNDLRWRMIWQKEVLGLETCQVAANLGVDYSTVWRIVKLFRETGDVQKKKQPGAVKALTSVAELITISEVLEHPGIMLHEFQAKLLELTGIDVCLSTICRFLQRSGFSRQKLKIVAIQREDFLRAQFTSDVSVYEPEMLIFLDETGSDKRNTIRKHGYSLKGKPLVSHELMVRGERISAIAFMSMNGMLDCKTVRHSVNGDTFYEFIQATLLPHLMTFNGTNPHSVVIMDNCSIHHINDVVQMINQIGALVHFLPPYSPDYNPIEAAFSKVKTNLKTLDNDLFHNPEEQVLAAFSTITVNDYQQWIRNVGIYNVD